MQSAQEFNRYSIAVFDWSQSLVYANEARKQPSNSTVYEALLFSAIVCYYRPFSPNEKGAKAQALSQLSIDDFPLLSSAEHALHENCKKLRNKALAHSEFMFNPTGLGEKTGVITSKPFSLLSQPFDLEAFIKLVSKLELVGHHQRADHVREQHGRMDSD